jgi:hypothetical protein
MKDIFTTLHSTHPFLQLLVFSSIICLVLLEFYEFFVLYVTTMETTKLLLDESSNFFYDTIPLLTSCSLDAFGVICWCGFITATNGNGKFSLFVFHSMRVVRCEILKISSEFKINLIKIVQRTLSE